ncbi:MAG TPA: sulfite exporter TauE/SafE family protein [Burkholderiaceae bacterium]|nr:sulfite exporter TauE/SafE family protein [Burkholderiaceae bacterium]
MDWTIVIALLALGATVGFMAGLLGIGGGMMMVPFLTMLLPYVGVPSQWLIHAAIATSMTTIVFTSMSSVRAHQAEKAILWPIVAIMAPGVVVGGLLSGGAVFAYLSGFGLSLFFAVFIGYSGYRMLKPRPVPESRTMPGAPTTFGVGAGIGFISGLVGAGGGFLSVPFMTRSNISIHNAVATSAALGFFIAVANSAGYIYSGFSAVEDQAGMLGYIYWPALLIIALMSVLTAPLGARYAHSLPVATLRRIFACLLFALSAYMMVKAWQQF